ncbi:MAG: nucleoside hydrolase [Phycisphaerae bacterium]|nr:nucleoside hydrolase [Phycisphaerae bacterium]
MRTVLLRRVIASCPLLIWMLIPVTSHAEPPRTRVPYIHSTDLLHPHEDPDDHFDLATAYALEELDIRAILLDLGDRQKLRSGRLPVEQLNKLTGRRVPSAAGLSVALKSPDDKGLDQPKEDQGAIELLLKVLRESSEPVILNTLGSERDVCAAFNREPELLRKKISRLYVNAGGLKGDEREWNVRLDPLSYVGLMRSGLPISWCPCQPTNVNLSTHWVFKHKDVLESMPAGLLNFFIYALQRVPPGEIDPMAALAMDLRPWRHILMEQDRNMWSTASILDAAGRSIYRVGDRWVAARSAPAGGQLAEVFRFIPVRVEIDNRAVTRWKEAPGDPTMRVYQVADAKNHQAAMASCLRQVLENFPVVTGLQ